MKPPEKEFHVAPMLDVSTIEFRYFIRLLTRRAFIWTEMVVAETLVYNAKNQEFDQIIFADDHDEVELNPTLRRYCGYWDEREFLKDLYPGKSFDYINPHPTICQIGTNDPEQAAFATRIVQKCGYDRIDLNAECPSDRVTGKREFGAALMKDQDSAVSVVKSIAETVKAIDQSTFCNGDSSGNFEHHTTKNKCLPISVKTRIGVDEHDTFEHIVRFIGQLVDAGCHRFVIHARKVYTQGLSPAQNRTVPPLNYPFAYKLMEAFPECEFIVNGGIMCLEHARKVAFGCSSSSYESREGSGMQSLENGRNGGLSVPCDHSVPCDQCNLPHGSCLAPPNKSPANLQGVMVGRLARDHPSELADVDRFFYGEASNPCKNRRELMEKYIAFLERVYPRRCCDDDEFVTLGMITDMECSIRHRTQYCKICRDISFQGDPIPDDSNSYEECKIDKHEESLQDRKMINPLPTNPGILTQFNTLSLPTITPTPSSTLIITPTLTQNSQSQKRHKRLTHKSPGAKIVSRVIDRALQPTLGILFGLPGNSKFRRELHRLSRDMEIRNCGPGYILKRAMMCVSKDVWDRPFVLNDGSRVAQYVPSK
mmetsp:Transcript_49/g.119  ORF Transcript_49/g.119 Transcript_49/m.119 type:complete len:595 (-) Transcript_49:60-1844(-)